MAASRKDKKAREDASEREGERRREERTGRGTTRMTVGRRRSTEEMTRRMWKHCQGRGVRGVGGEGSNYWELI